MPRLVVASNNRGKIREIARLLQDPAIQLVAQSEFDVPAIAETGGTFVENAILKARNAARHTGLASMGEDSGLEVDALSGAPGIYSARYAGSHASDTDNNRRLLEALHDVDERSARYRCVAVVMRHADDPTPLICQGTWEGTIMLNPAGKNGFGYDPLFLPAGSERTAAELGPAEKNRISHRARALAQLAETLGPFLA